MSQSLNFNNGMSQSLELRTSAELLAMYDKLNLRPIYQRPIQWTADAINELINTVMTGKLFPIVYMYELQPDQKYGCNEGKDYEVIDGQHRTFSIWAFRNATYQKVRNTKKPFVVYWNIKIIGSDGKESFIKKFYKDTPDVRDWCENNGISEPLFLSNKEKEQFDSFNIGILTIRSTLSVKQRSIIFLDLQKGKPVRGADRYKNMTDCQFINFISERGYEHMMTDIFFKHCTMKAYQYFTQWVIRCFNMFRINKMKNSDVVPFAFIKGDKILGKYIEKNHFSLNGIDEDLLIEFDTLFQSFIDILDSESFKETCKNGITKDIELNPTQIFALFYWSCDENADIASAMSHIQCFSKEGALKPWKTLWDTYSNDERIKYFNDCYDKLLSYKEEANPIDNRPISAALRKKVWQKCVNGMCACCEEIKIDENNFEAGHIQSRAFNGQTELDNLLPICFDCNRTMGKRNLFEYKKNVYPELCNDMSVLKI